MHGQGFFFQAFVSLAAAVIANNAPKSLLDLDINDVQVANVWAYPNGQVCSSVIIMQKEAQAAVIMCGNCGTPSKTDPEDNAAWEFEICLKCGSNSVDRFNPSDTNGGGDWG